MGETQMRSIHMGSVPNWKPGPPLPPHRASTGDNTWSSRRNSGPFRIQWRGDVGFLPQTCGREAMKIKSY